MTNKANGKFQVQVGYNGRGARYVYFISLDSARNFCNDVASRTHIILSVIEVKQ